VAAYKKDYEEKLAAIKLEVAEYQKKMRDEALSLANEMIGKVKDEVDKKIAKARKDMEIQFETSKVALEAEAGALADLIVENESVIYIKELGVKRIFYLFINVIIPAATFASEGGKGENPFMGFSGDLLFLYCSFIYL